MERWHIQLNPSYNWSAHEDDTLWANQGHHWYSWPCKGHFRCGSKIPRLVQLNCKWLGLSFYLEILVMTMLLPWNPAKALHCFPSPNWWLDQEEKQYIEAYRRVFVNFEQDDWAKFLPIAEFVYNNTKNASNGHMLFELNCGFHLQASYKKDINPRF